MTPHQAAAEAKAEMARARVDRRARKPQPTTGAIVGAALMAMFRSPFLPFAAINNKIVGIYDGAPQEITGPLKAFFTRRPRPWRYYGNNARRGKRRLR